MYVYWLIFLYYLIYSNNYTNGQNLPVFPQRIFSPITQIIGGQLAEIEDYPHHVSVRLWDVHVCGGSILDKKTILTAAHCTVLYSHKGYSVRVGSTYKNKGDIYEIEKIIEHPYHNKTITSDYDYAIIKLKTSLKFSKTVKPIEMIATNFQIPSNSSVTTIGWGLLKEEDKSGPEELRQVELQTITNLQCAQFYGILKITRNMLCALAPGKDSCQGDSGGPLIFDGKLCGVVSFGVGCARPRVAGVYSSIAANRPWIEMFLEECKQFYCKQDNILTSSDIVSSVAEKLVQDKIGDRIVGGTYVNIEKYPFIVSLRCYDQHYCSGVILDSCTILTAAHCVIGFPLNDLSIKIGSTNNKLGKEYKISTLSIHPEFNQTKELDFDALDKELTFSEKVKPVGLPEPEDELSPWTLITVLGWGTEGEGSDLLKATELRTIDSFQCGQAYGHGKLTKNMFCAMDYAKDSCEGDSGAPAVFQGLLFGIVSTREGCAKPGYPGIYTKVSKLLDWIKPNLDDKNDVNILAEIEKSAPVVGVPKKLSNDIKSYPYQASLRVLDQHICEAVIISRKTLLTAAHCAKLYPVKDYSVRVGNNKHKAGAKYDIQSILVHPGFNKTVLMDLDVALIKLKGFLTYSANVQPISLMRKDLMEDGMTFVISGWGVTKDGATIVKDTLLAAEASLVDIEDCRNKYGEEQITKNMICATQPIGGTCEGDSGAPLVCNSQLAGIAAFNTGCTIPGYPGVYVKISSKAIYEWIMINL